MAACIGLSGVRPSSVGKQDRVYPRVVSTRLPSFRTVHRGGRSTVQAAIRVFYVDSAISSDANISVGVKRRISAVWAIPL